MEKIMMLQCNSTSPYTQLCPTTISTTYTCSLSCSNIISFRFPRRINMGFYSFQKKSKRNSVVNLSKANFWEEVEYGVENKEMVNSTNGLSSSNYEEEFMKEVEQLLSPEGKAILDRNQTPEMDKISTAKWNPLHTFALAGQIRFIDRLLEEGLDIDVVDKEGQTALHHVCLGKKEAVISHLLRKGANHKATDMDGVTPLYYAVQAGAMQTVKMLIKYKVDVNVTDNDGKTPLDISLCYDKDFKSYDLAKLLKLVPANREL